MRQAVQASLAGENMLRVKAEKIAVSPHFIHASILRPQRFTVFNVFAVTDNKRASEELVKV